MRVYALTAFCAGTALLGAGAVDKPAPDAVRGRKLFEMHCSTCHSVDADHKLAPGLKGLFSKRKLQNGNRPTEANVRAVIEQGRNGMPPFRDMLRNAEKSDLLEYLKTL